MSGKSLLFVGSSLKDVKDFPASVRRDVGHALHLLQLGLQPSDWRPMAAVGPGVAELRLRDNDEYRVIYIARFSEAIYVLHAFAKRTRKTRKADIELARHRLNDVGQQHAYSASIPHRGGR